MNNINVDKKNILNEIQRNEQNDMTYEKVDLYLREYPGDTDMIIIKAYLLLIDDNIEDGIEELEFVLQKCPFSVDALFLLGQAYNEENKYYDALVCLGRAVCLNCFYNDINWILFNQEICLDIIKNIIDNVEGSSDLSIDKKIKYLMVIKRNLVITSGYLKILL